MLYLPAHGGRVDVALLAGHNRDALGSDIPAEERPVGTVSDIAGSQLTRDRLFGLMVIPADLTLDEGMILRITQRVDYKGVGMSPVYFGPRATIEPIADQHKRFGRFMQLLIPIVALITIAISTLLIFFSRHPLKYIFLIAAFMCQLTLELADEPALAMLGLQRLTPFLSVITNCMIGLAIAAWTAARRWQRNSLIVASAVVLLLRLALRVTGVENEPHFHAIALLLFAIWIFAVQILAWAMIIGARRIGGFVRTGALATFFLSGSGLLAYHGLSVTRPAIGLVFFLANWVNLASALGVLIFVFGALTNEILAYAEKRRDVAALEQIIAGHHGEMDEQAKRLRLEIERGAVLEERQRFLRDMHDGLGGQLLTLLLRMRRSERDASSFAEDVQSIIGDLRLMTSASNDEGISLVAALDRLRERIQAQCRSSDMKLAWQMDLASGVELSLGDILNVLRIVEEAATNAVRHSGGKLLTISFSAVRMLEIAVQDDGQGYDQTITRPGTGLRSIEQRTRRLGGKIEITADCSGTCLRIAIPLGGVSQIARASPVAALHEQPRFST